MVFSVPAPAGDNCRSAHCGPWARNSDRTVDSSTITSSWCNVTLGIFPTKEAVGQRVSPGRLPWVRHP